MKISLCKNNKGNKKTKEFLERNLRKVKIDEKDCLGMCSDCKKKVVAIVDGKEISAKDEYTLLKEIKKILKKSDNLDLLVQDIKKEIKEKAEKVKEEKIKDKDKNASKGKESDKVKESKEDKKKAEKSSKSEDKKRKPEEEVKAEVIGDELILTLPNETYSLSNLKITVNFGSFGTSDSTYEVKKTDEAKDEAFEKERDTNATLRFSPSHELQIDKPAEKINESTYEVKKTEEIKDESAKKERDTNATLRFSPTHELQIEKSGAVVNESTYEVKKTEEVKDNDSEKEREAKATLRFESNPELQIDKPVEKP